MKHPEDKDLFILVLDAGIQHQKDGITFNELREFVEKNGYPLVNKADIDLLSNLYFGVFFKSNLLSQDPNEKQRLNEEGYFKYLNYKALCETRKTSTRTTYLAILAIIVAAASLIFSIFQNN